MGDIETEDAVGSATTAPDTETSKVPQSQRPGGKKRKVALFVAFVGAGYSVRNPTASWEGWDDDMVSCEESSESKKLNTNSNTNSKT